MYTRLILLLLHLNVLSLSVCSVSVQLDVEIQPVEDSNCIGGNVGLTNTSVLLEYRQTTDSVTGWVFLAEISPSEGIDRTLEIAVDSTLPSGVQLRLLQLEHGGGMCNCWEVERMRLMVPSESDVTVDMEIAFTDANTCSRSGDENVRIFCNGLARDVRGVISRVFTFDGTIGSCPGDTGSMLVSAKGTPFGESCTDVTPRIEVMYQLLLDVEGTSSLCDGLEEDINEAIEFAIRNDTSRNGRWIPLRVSYYNSSFSASRTTTEIVRGYQVPASQNPSSEFKEKVTLCGDMLLSDEIQFRWMGTAQSDVNVLNNVIFRSDMWALTSVTANLITADETFTLIEDTFGSNTLNSSVWMEPRRGSVNCEACRDTQPCVDHYLTFGAYNGSAVNNRVTRIAITNAFHLEQQTDVSITTTTQIPPTPAVSSIESSIKQKIISNEELKAIKDTVVPEEALDLIEALDETVDTAVILYLLANVLDGLTPESIGKDFVKGFLEVGSHLIDRNSSEEVDPAVIGASLLNVMDKLAFRKMLGSVNISTENIVAQTTLVPTDGRTYFTTINSANFDNSLPDMSIQVPTEVVRMFGESEGRAVSYLYFDLENLFPSGLMDEDNSTTRLGSGIVSTALQCGTGRCPTDNLELERPVIITIHHSETERLTKENQGQIAQCVFWEFLPAESPEDALLSIGQWSDRGCVKNESLSNNSVTVCECNHLTHFAILLSAAPLNVSDDVTLSLQIIGYVGVSISLVAMAITIITFVVLKSLHNMRSYIHTNLCISLGIAQIIFVAGIDRTQPDGVPTDCQAIAVLLHYFFLVSFMWMLMEGVVLYVVLVRVFVSKTKRYMLAFTIASYGIPLLYLGALTLPLGFALNKQPNYGYKEACFLNPETHFIWAFISPVILIILLNSVFFVIVGRVMWKHQKKFTDSATRENVKKWLRSALSLVVIMGLTWIFGVLIVEVKALLPLAYIYTILVAFQGLWIFLIFVVFSPQVRNAYAKWWRSKVNESDFLSKYFGQTAKISLESSSVAKPSQVRGATPSCVEAEDKDILSATATSVLESGDLQSDSSPVKVDNLYQPYRNSNAFRLPMKQENVI